MPNYLVNDETGLIIVDPVSGGIEDDKSNFDNVNNSPSINNPGGSTNPYSAVGIGTSLLGQAQGGGSKPEALHTEYADDGDEGPAYGTQDIVFYLERADGDSNGPTGDALTDEAADGAEQIGQNANIGLDGSTGPNPDSGDLQSGANQIGAGSFAAGNIVDEVEGSQMAPIVGMSIDDEEDLGLFTQNAGASVDVGRAVSNAVRAVDSLDLNTLNTSLASSEYLFTKLLARNFAFGEDLSGTRDDETILNTLNRPAFSELSFLLARASGGRARVKDIVRAVNDGTIGLVTGKSRAYQQRLGSSGRAPR